MKLEELMQKYREAHAWWAKCNSNIVTLFEELGDRDPRMVEARRIYAAAWVARQQAGIALLAHIRGEP